MQRENSIDLPRGRWDGDKMFTQQQIYQFPDENGLKSIPNCFEAKSFISDDFEEDFVG